MKLIEAIRDSLQGMVFYDEHRDEYSILTGYISGDGICEFVFLDKTTLRHKYYASKEIAYMRDYEQITDKHLIDRVERALKNYRKEIKDGENGKN